jgi:hypothetical protein
MIASWVLGIICWKNFNEGLGYHRSSNILFHLSSISRYNTVYVESILRKENFRTGVLITKDVEQASFDVTADRTKFVLVGANAPH